MNMDDVAAVLRERYAAPGSAPLDSRWLACGFVAATWRNDSMLEDLHAGVPVGDVEGLTDAECEAARVRYEELLASGDEAAAIRGLAARVARGGGIPDAWMLRMNASVTAQVADVIASAGPGFSVRGGYRWSNAAASVIASPELELRMGGVVYPARSLFGRAWEPLHASLVDAVAVFLGALEALEDPQASQWLCAQYAQWYCHAWWGSPQWKDVPAVLERMDVPDFVDPQTLHARPWDLDGRAAQWLANHRYDLAALLREM